MRRRLTLAFACGLALAAVGSVAPAATPAEGVLTPGQTVRWDGIFTETTPLSPEASLSCHIGLCDPFRLDVQLGDSYWAEHDGALEITIRWDVYDGETDLDLYVYDDQGNEVARSAGVDSNAESVFIPSAADGTYVVQTAPSTMLLPELHYAGVAQVELAPEGTGEDLLPNLVALKPSNFHIATAGGLLPRPENPLISCYAEETVENPDHPTRCLRFDQIIANVGDGKLELRFDVTKALSPEDEQRRMIQRIFRDDGTYRDRQGDAYEFHATHGHIHYAGFGQSFLYPYDFAAGERIDDDARERAGRKVGFCVIDVFLLEEYFGAPGNGPRNHTFPTCNVPTEYEPTGTAWLVQGVDVGWADVYGWNLPDQYIDVTGLADGVYELEQVANPLEQDSVLEARYDDNRASAIICLEGSTATPVNSQADADSCASYHY